MNSDLGLLVEYIRQNRETYTREAITERLLSSGYEPEAIEEAWRTSTQEKSAPGARRFFHRQVFWLAILGAVAICYVIVGGLYWMVVAMLGFDLLASGAAVYILAGAIGLLVGLLLAGALLIEHNRSVALGLALSGLLGLIVVPVVAAAVFYGLCVAQLNL